MLKVLVKLKYIFSAEKQFRKLISSITGFEPGDVKLYRLALTHRSADNGFRKDPMNNERLEFLGDAILDAIVAEYLFYQFPGKDEGFLTVIRSRIVNGETLYQLAMKTGLWRLIQYHPSATSKKHIFGDAFEALIGAIYIDKGYKKTYQFFIHQILEKHIDLEQVETNDTNYKSLLLEFTQKNKLQIAFETREAHETNEHNPVFEAHIFINQQFSGFGTGKSKKEAEQNASKAALEKYSFLIERFNDQN